MGTLLVPLRLFFLLCGRQGSVDSGAPPSFLPVRAPLGSLRKHAQSGRAHLRVRAGHADLLRDAEGGRYHRVGHGTYE